MDAGFVLLEQEVFDLDAVLVELEEKWGIEARDEKNEEGTIVFNVGDMMVAISHMPAPVPNGEAEENAKTNFLWKEAVERVSQHQSHVIVSILNGEDKIEQAKLFVKVAASVLGVEGAIGIYILGTVFKADFYRTVAEDLQNDELPIMDWVYFGVYRGDKGVNAYTYGLDFFGKDEIEILDSSASLGELYEFMVTMAGYVIEADATLLDGQTIGFTVDQKLPITRSKGVAVEGDTVKIGYKPVKATKGKFFGLFK